MAVVIKDFEIVTESPPANNSNGSAANSNAATSSKASTPRDIERILQRQAERLARVRTY